MKRKITKKELKWFGLILFSLVIFTLLANPINSLWDSLKLSMIVRIIIAFLIGLGVLKWFKIA